MCAHALAIGVAVLALFRTRHTHVTKSVRFDLEKITAEASSWKSTALSLRADVESAIDRLELKRRQLSAIESRMVQRESREDTPIEEPQPPNEVELADMDRSTARRIRREERMSG